MAGLGPSQTKALSAWLDETIPLDPLLKAPLDLFGVHCRRRTQVAALMRQLGLEHRLNVGTPVRDTTYEVIFDMLGRLGYALGEKRIHLETWSGWVIVGLRDLEWQGLDRAKAATALLDLGWGHLHVEGGDVRDVLLDMKSLYIEQMKPRVFEMLERWTTDGYLVAKGK